MTLKEKICNKEKIAGTFLRTVRNPAVVLMAKNAGLDFVLFDCEHSDYNLQTLQDAFILADAVGLGGFIRVPCGSRDYVSRALDIGALGIMVPLIETKEETEEFVKYAKYPPIGKRGFGGGGPYTGYQLGNFTETMNNQNERTITIAQIETKLAVENVEEIASVEGLDALFVGPLDLSIALDIPGDIMNPIELEAIKKVADACKKYNKAFGMFGTKELLAKFAGDLQIVTMGMDSAILSAGFADIRKNCDSL